MDTAIIVRFGMTMIILLVAIAFLVVLIDAKLVLILVHCVMMYLILATRILIMQIVELEFFMEDVKIYD